MTFLSVSRMIFFNVANCFPIESYCEVDFEWRICSRGGGISNGGCSSELEVEEDEGFVPEILLREPYLTLAPPVGFLHAPVKGLIDGHHYR
jgi:hypothetical protein